MRYPTLSTITYLSGDATASRKDDTLQAPTLILNQTTPDGNSEVPLTPKHGWLAYPHANKHVVFRGDLQHGVHGELGSKGGERRVTLLVNWWKQAPIPPNCNALSSKEYSEHGLFRRTAVSALPIPRKYEGPAPGSELPILADLRLRNHHKLPTYGVTFPPTDIFRFALPGRSELTALRRKSATGLLEVLWSDRNSLAGLKELDLESSNLMRHVRRC